MKFRPIKSKSILSSLGRQIAVRRHLLLRSFSRSEARESGGVRFVMAGGIGIAAGLVVALLNLGVGLLHKLLFNVPADLRLSNAVGLDPWRILLLPVIGGLAVGVTAWVLKKFRPRDVVDAIEANALYGGRMSFRDSLGLVLLTVLSGGFGASVGLEAAYTQLSSALGSRLGISLKLRREDVRTLVGCGSAGAIAAAFNAPLAGAFYAFELVIGSYTLATLAPIAIAALMGGFTARWLFGTEPVFVVQGALQLQTHDYYAFALLGLASAGLGVLVMKGVTSTEAWFKQWRTPVWLRPMLGGLIVGGIAMGFPPVLGSGHGAILHNLQEGYALPILIGLVAAKILASAISIGAGFRGGLFSSSLFLGSLFGSAVAMLMHWALPWIATDQQAYTLVAMGSVAAAIVGAPVTMILLVLETTGDFSVSIGVMVGVVVAAAAVRQWFGYSFATWRFHLRGMKIRSAEDIGWINELKIGRLMRRDQKIIRADSPLSTLRQAFLLGSTRQVFAVDGENRLVGVVDVAEAHSPDTIADPNKATVRDLVHAEPAFLLPAENLRTALQLFQTAAVETLPVVNDANDKRIIGYVTEKYALRRYSEELEKRRGAADDSGLFSPSPNPSPHRS
ncbi:chloride channel protein [Dongia soli]|uniref:Chloride channel protein n=1 Tax=Dongia soli TaxID=600628 RepID=A0ABU5E641_9PROT|nr:chloride channel protein [Dongia soli]MDY0881509.1 chloride channel protein [Dongia soli]